MTTNTPGFIASGNPLIRFSAYLERRTLSSVLTAVPAFLVSFDPVTQMATVQTAIKHLTNSQWQDAKYSDPSVLINVPVYIYGTADFSIELPLKPNDEGLIVFCKESIQNWVFSKPNELGNMEAVEPSTVEIFTLNDAVFFAGFRPQSQVIPNYRTDDGIRLRNKSGTHEIGLGNDKATVISEDIELTSRAGDIKLESLTADIELKTNNAELYFGTTGEPTIPPVYGQRTIKVGEKWDAGGYKLDNLTDPRTPFDIVEKQTAATSKWVSSYFMPKTLLATTLHFTDTITSKLSVGGVLLSNPTEHPFSLWFMIGSTVGHGFAVDGHMDTTLYAKGEVDESLGVSINSDMELTVTASGSHRFSYIATFVQEGIVMTFNDNQTVSHTLTDGGVVIADSVRSFGLHFLSKIGDDTTAGQMTLFNDGSGWHTSSTLYSATQPHEHLAFSVASNGAGGLELTITGTGAGSEVYFSYNIVKPLGVLT